MNKKKLILSLSTGVPVLAGLTSAVCLCTGCSCATYSAIPTDYLNISNDTLKGFKENVDYSKYTCLEIPSNVRNIEKSAFKDCFKAGSTVNTIKFSKNIRHLDDNVFEGCNGITTFDLSNLDEEAVKYINWGNNLFGTDETNKPVYINIKLNNGLSDSAKKELKDKLIAAGIPAASFAEKVTDKVEVKTENKTKEVADSTKVEMTLTLTEEEKLTYVFKATADRDGGTPGVGVKLGEVKVEEITNETKKYKASVDAEIVNAKNNGDYVTYKIDMIAMAGNEVKWVQTIENFKLVYNKDLPATVVHVTGVSLDKPSLEIETGKDATLVETVTPSDATDKSVSWTSDNPEVASVVNGTVTGVSEGSTTIKVKTTDGGFEASCNVTIKDADVEISEDVKELGVSVQSSSLVVGEDSTITLGLPEMKQLQGVTMQVGNAVLTENEVTVRGAKIAIPAQYMTVARASIQSVTLADVLDVELSIDTSNAWVRKDRTLKLVATTTYEGKEVFAPVDWSSSDSSIAKVNDEGVVTGVSQGTAVITAKAGTKTVTCSINVKDLTKLDENYTNLTNNGEQNATVSFSKDSNTSTSVQYSKDGSQWNNLDSTGFNIAPGETFYLKGNNPEGFNKIVSSFPTTNKIVISNGSNVSLAGTALSLVLGDDVETTTEWTMPHGCFAYTFCDCKGLTKVDPTYLSHNLLKNLSNYSYKNMFYYSGIKSAPDLPAETMQYACYYDMFMGATNLITTPKILAKTMTDYCCYEMFRGCTALTTTPNLSNVTSLAENCFRLMFVGCTKLVSASSLPNVDLQKACYYGMFYNCSSLVRAPALPSVNLANNCYSQMFYGCSSLQRAPELPATKLIGYCYYQMFYGCKKLIYAPNIYIESGAEYACQYMYRECEALTIPPKITFASGVEVRTRMLNSMFMSCKGLKVKEVSEDPNAFFICPPLKSQDYNHVDDMFIGTSGSFAGTPTAGKYYVIEE